MKTTQWIMLGAFTASCAIVNAEEEKKRPDRSDRPHRPIPEALLEKFDTDGDGKLSPDERKVMGEKMKAKGEERRKAMLARFDANSDGELDEAERKIMHETIRKEMLEKYDANKDGKLDEAERKAMREAEGPMMRPGGHREHRHDGGERRNKGPRPERKPAPEPAPVE